MLYDVLDVLHVNGINRFNRIDELLLSTDISLMCLHRHLFSLVHTDLPKSYFNARQILVDQDNVDILPYRRVSGHNLEV